MTLSPGPLTQYLETWVCPGHTAAGGSGAGTGQRLPGREGLLAVRSAHGGLGVFAKVGVRGHKTRSSRGVY